MGTGRRWLLIGAVAVAMAVVAMAVVVFRGGNSSLPREETRAFLAAWSSADAEAVDRLATSSSRPSTAQAMFREALAVADSKFTVRAVKGSEGKATAEFTAVHTLRGLGEWRVRSSVDFVRQDGKWRVDWHPKALHPDAEPGATFERSRTWPPRASILGGDGQPLTTMGTVVSIGVQPSRITNQASVGAALQQHLGVDPAQLERALKAPGVMPDHFVPVIDVREERYKQVDPALRPIPGVIFKRKPARVTPRDGFAAHTLGRTGEITAEQLETFDSVYQRGDIVGQSGLELAYESDLAGRPAGDVTIVGAGGAKHVVHRFEGTPPKPLAITLRASVQVAADEALEGVAGPAAIVAVDSATGAILGVASGPRAEPLNRALAGMYAPGSTFKIVTVDALIAAAGPTQTLACPKEATVGGKVFTNFEGEALGDVSLRDAFVHSCNTAFVGAAAELSNDDLERAAKRYGFGVPYRMGLGRRSGAVFPAPDDDAERAAAAIGQGRVLATPAHMASVAAAATSGTWRAPHLLATGRESTTAAPTAMAVESLRSFMRAVVTEGTARAAAGVPGLVGKTGTAEYGSGDPLPTHAWFVGERNGVGFAVLLEGGGVGGRAAAPVAAKFAAAL